MSILLDGQLVLWDRHIVYYSTLNYNLTVIIDVHTHIFSPEIASRRDYYCTRDICFSLLYADKRAQLKQAEDLIRSMDANYIDRSVVLNIGWTNGELCSRNNDYIIESVMKFPDRLIGFCSIQPLDGDQALAELERCFKAGMRGVGELRPDVQGYDLNDSRLISPVVAMIRQYRAVLSLHASEPVGHNYAGKGAVTPGILYRFIKDHSGLNIILAHFGGGLPFYELMPEVHTSLQQTYYDSAAAPFLYNPAIYQTVGNICSYQKILFGSDWPLLDQSRVIKHIDSSSLAQPARESILFGNAARLFDEADKKM